MKPYHKIHSLFTRDQTVKFKKVIAGEYSKPEFKFLERCEWVYTEKIDGTNIRIMFDGGKISFAGKEEKSQIPVPLMNWLFENIFSQTDMFKERFYPKEHQDSISVCLYGEGFGDGIQKPGKLYQDFQSFILFDANINGWWLERDSVVEIAEALNIPVVPIIGEGDLFLMTGLVKEGFNSVYGNFPAEGIVARPKVELQNRAGQRIITKLKTRDF